MQAGVSGEGHVHLASETSHGGLQEVRGVLGGEFHLVRDLVQVLDGDGACPVKAVCNTDGVDASVKESFALFQQRASKDLHAIV